MKPKLTAVLVLIGITCSIGLTASLSRSNRSSANSVRPNQPISSDSLQQGTVVDGAQHPDAVPDKLAYTLLFRFLSGRNTEADKNRARSYLKMVFGCDTCPNAAMTKQQRAGIHTKIEALITMAEQFERENRPFDDEAKNLRQNAGLSRDAITRSRLKALQDKKEALVQKLIDSLRTQLGAEGAGAVHSFMLDQLKRKVKITGGKPRQSGSGGTT